MTPIPPFPAWRPLAIGDRPAIEAAIAGYPPYSDYGFTSLWAWDTRETCALSLLNGNLVVRFQDYTTEEPFYSFLGGNAVTETAGTLLERARQEGLPARLSLVPEAVVAADPRLPRHLSVAEDRDNHDYVYAFADWVALAGHAFARLRQQIRRCRPRVGFAFRSLELHGHADRAAMLALFRCWAAQKPALAGEDRQHELSALRRLFALPPSERLGACGLEDGGRLVAFSVWEGLPGGVYCVTHFRKSDRSYEGLAAYLQHEESRLLLERWYEFMNVEQDLGIAGLRAYKLSLRPCGFLRKFVIAESPRRELAR
jgi:hypothetical protein